MPHQPSMPLTASRGVEANQRPSCFGFHFTAVPNQDPAIQYPLPSPDLPAVDPLPWPWRSGDIESLSCPDRIEWHVPDKKQAFVPVLRRLGIHDTPQAPSQAALRRTATSALFRSTTLPTVAAPNPRTAGVHCVRIPSGPSDRLKHGNSGPPDSGSVRLPAGGLTRGLPRVSR